MTRAKSNNRQVHSDDVKGFPLSWFVLTTCRGQRIIGQQSDFDISKRRTTSSEVNHRSFSWLAWLTVFCKRHILLQVGVGGELLAE